MAAARARPSSFFAYLGDRLGVPAAAAVPPLAPLVRASAPA